MGFGEGVPVNKQTCRLAGRFDTDSMEQGGTVVFLVTARIEEGRFKMVRGDSGEQNVDYVAKVEDAVVLRGAMRDQAIVFMAHGGDQGEVTFELEAVLDEPSMPNLRALTSGELMGLVREGGDLADAAEEELLARTASSAGETPPGAPQTSVSDAKTVPTDGPKGPAVMDNPRSEAINQPEVLGVPEAPSETPVSDPAYEESVAAVLGAMGTDEEYVPPSDPVPTQGRPSIYDYKRGKKGRPREGVKHVTLEELDRIAAEV